jgi:hypothetical protein
MINIADNSCNEVMKRLDYSKAIIENRIADVEHFLKCVNPNIEDEMTASLLLGK